MDNNGNNTPKKHYRKRNYHNKGKKPNRQERTADAEELNEAVSGLSQSAGSKSIKNPDQKEKNGNPPSHKSNHSNKNKHSNKPVRDGKSDAEPKTVRNNTPDSIDESIIDKVDELDAIEENESVSELLMLDGTDNLDLVAEENDENSKKEGPGKTEAQNDEEEVTYEVIGVRFGAATKTYYFDPSGLNISVGKGVIVETVRGDKYGICNMHNSFVPAKNVFLPLKKVIRIASEDDKILNEENIALAEDAFKKCNKKIAEHGLDMKLIEATYTHDRSKLIFFFTAPTRVDFRELVKDLAFLFKTRIDLRQIGIRDEAKMIGGYGICGRPLCCCSFLPNFNQVSIKMAKEQNLSLNTSKISGVCGRLMCCLKFEHKTYLDEARLMPPVGSLVKTVDGVGEVTEVNPIGGTVKVRIKDNQDAVPKSYPHNEVNVLKRGDSHVSEGDSEADSTN